jgi:hypothetical protein
MTDKPKTHTAYHTQWAGQFYVAAELTRRGYYVTFTLGNAPRTDLLAASPKGRTFRVEVKTQATKNFWLIRRHPVEPDHFYILVFLPKQGCPEFFILTCAEVQRLRQEYADRSIPRGRYRDDLGGLNWTTPQIHKDKWDVLPE